MKLLKRQLAEALHSVLPIAGIVLALSVTACPMDAGLMVLFLFGCLLLVGGMSLFTLGSGISMEPLGAGIGVQMNKSRRLPLSLACCFVLGVLITIAEPDLTVLAEQIPGIPNLTLILCVAAGVGLFLVVAMLRTLKGLRLNWLLMGFYLLAGVAAIFAPRDFLPLAFDSGGVTTGPITVPFIMALGAGMASVRGDSHAEENSFGLIALCSIGPILSVLLLSIFYRPEAAESTVSVLSVHTTRDAFLYFASAAPRYVREVTAAFLPMVGVFILFQALYRRYRLHQVLKISMGFVYTYVGLVMFLTGANVAFMPVGQMLGSSLATHSPGALIAAGAVIGFFTVAAEPAVAVLKKQVEEVSSGRIRQGAIAWGLSVGVAISVGLSMLRIVLRIPIDWFLIGGYALSLAISFFVPGLYTGIAFDSGGVASGPMTTTFILPFAMGACRALGGNVMQDAFGIVAMVAMTPLITIQLMGLWSEVRHRARHRRAVTQIDPALDGLVYYDAEEA